LGDTVAPYFGSVLILGGAAAALKNAAHANGSAAVLTQAEQAASVKLPGPVMGWQLVSSVPISMVQTRAGA